MIESTTLNGINMEALRATVEAITKDPAKAMTHWEVTSHWRGGTRSDSRVKRCVIGGQQIDKDFTSRLMSPCNFAAPTSTPIRRNTCSPPSMRA